MEIEGTFRAHQVPLSELASKPDHIRILEDWMKSYRPEELFDEGGKLMAEIAEIAPKGDRRMGANPHANGGLFLKDLDLPDFRDYAVDVPAPGAVTAEATRVMGRMLRDVMKRNLKTANFRVVGPDETNSNRLGALFEVTDRDVHGDDSSQRRSCGSGGTRDGGAERTHVRGVAGRISTDRASRIFLAATRPSSTSSTRCSTSTPSG